MKILLMKIVRFILFNYTSMIEELKKLIETANKYTEEDHTKALLTSALFILDKYEEKTYAKMENGINPRLSKWKHYKPVKSIYMKNWPWIDPIE